MSNQREREIALREARCIDAEQAYFDARPAMDTNENHRLFRAGYERGYDAMILPEPYAFTDEKIDCLIQEMEGGIDGFLKQWGYRQFAKAVERAHGIYGPEDFQ